MHQHEAGASGQLTLRADSGFYSHAVVDWRGGDCWPRYVDPGTEPAALRARFPGDDGRDVFWIDKATGLFLRVRGYSASGRLASQTEITLVDINE